MKKVLVLMLVLGMATLANAAVISLSNVSTTVAAVSNDTGNYAYEGWINLAPGLTAVAAFTPGGNPNGNSTITPFEDYGDGTGLWAQFSVASMDFVNKPLLAGNQILVTQATGSGLVSLFEADGATQIGQSVLLTPEPATMLILGLGGLLLRRK